MATAGDTRGLAGYRALVTGSTQGIGAAVATRLREAGAMVLGTGRKPPDTLASDDLFVARMSLPPKAARLSRAP